MSDVANFARAGGDLGLAVMWRRERRRPVSRAHPRSPRQRRERWMAPVAGQPVEVGHVLFPMVDVRQFLRDAVLAPSHRDIAVEHSAACARPH